MPNESLEAEKQLKSDVEQSIDYIEKFDILETINNVGNDEVFTPVKTCQKVLDILPDEVWHNPNYKWLNPCDKNGVFLREIALRLDKGLKDVIPNDEERKKHIMQDMIYSIGLTRFTSLVSRRTVYYCSSANRHFDGSEDDSDHHSVNGFAIGDGTWFDTEEGNILTPITDHKFGKDGKCIYCGTSENGKYTDPTQKEHYAYEFIHVHHLELQKHLQNRFFKGDRTMKFDIIIGNPPYQLSFGLTGGNSANAAAIYYRFISQAIALNPKYICMITPSRWMTRTAQGIPEEWVDEMLRQNKFAKIEDFHDSNECFPKADSNISLKGGCNYFLWNRDYAGKCEYTFHDKNGNIIKRSGMLDSLDAGVVVRNPISHHILEQIVKKDGKYYKEPSKNFYGFVSPKHFYDDGKILTSNWKEYKKERDNEHPIKYYISASFNDMSFGWVGEDQIPRHRETIGCHKVYIPAAAGSGLDPMVLGKPIYGEPGSICSQTYLVIGYDKNFTEVQCKNIISYIKTKFFRYLVSIVKTTQNGPRNVYMFVPIQNFTNDSDIDWSQSISNIDTQLYCKYDFDEDTQKIIESSIDAMD